MNIFELFDYRASNEEMIEAIKNLKDINNKNEHGQTCLHCACWHGRLEIVKVLVEHGADINIEDKYVWTPLFYACFNNNSKIIKFLIEHGANTKEEFEHWFMAESIYQIKLLTKAGACFL